MFVATRCCTLQLSNIWVSNGFTIYFKSVCKGIKLYLHEVTNINIAVCNPLWFTMSNLHRYFEIKSITWRFRRKSRLWRLTSLSRWSVAKFKPPCNFEESSYIARIFLPRVIHENIDIVFIENYRIHEVFWKLFSWNVIHFGLKKLSFWSVTNKNADIGKVTQSSTVNREMLNEATFNQTNFWFIYF